MLDFNAKYEILSFSVGDTKAGTKMGKMQLKKVDDGSILNCVLWEEALNRLPDIALRAGNIIRIITGSYNEKYNNCLLNNFEVLDTASLGIDEKKQNECFDFIVEFVNEFSSEKLKTFVLDILNKNKERFMTSPAAKHMHHNYIGGLIVHTKECVEIAKTILPVLKKQLNKDCLAVKNFPIA